MTAELRELQETENMSQECSRWCARSPFLRSLAEAKHFFFRILMVFQEADMLIEFGGAAKMEGFCVLLCFLAASRPNNSCI